MIETSPAAAKVIKAIDRITLEPGWRLYVSEPVRKEKQYYSPEVVHVRIATPSGAGMVLVLYSASVQEVDEKFILKAIIEPNLKWCRKLECHLKN